MSTITSSGPGHEGAAEGAKNIPGAEAVIDKLEKTANQGARRGVRKAREKAT